MFNCHGVIFVSPRYCYYIINNFSVIDKLWTDLLVSEHQLVIFMKR